MSIARPARFSCVLVAALALSSCSSWPGPAASWEPVAPGVERTLEAYRWQLESATDARGARIDGVALPDGRAFAFSFPAPGVVVDGGCNSMRGSVEVGAGRIRVGRLASTMKACDGALMQADAALAKLLAGPLKAAIDGSAEPRLRLVTAANDTLVLVGHATPETRYGAGTTMFLEVAAERVPCSVPPMRMATCLQVRERFFDAQGLPAGSPGQWRVLHGEIEGYAHREGERNVLRVKRYTRSPAPADAPAYVYVLDLVVESEVVKP
jgi:heat shock protein HslJ